MAVTLLIGLLLSACVRSFDPGTPVFDYGRPTGSIDLVSWR
jgi:hypothetical protein